MNPPSILTAALLALVLMPGAAHPFDGKALYERYCSVCHGGEGEGRRGPALRKDGLLRTVDAGYIKKTIRYGRKGGCPPSGDSIPEDEKETIASYVKGWQKGPDLTASSREVAPGYSKRGEEIFSLCGGCHGLEGEGAFGPTLLDAAFLKSVTDGELRRVIMYGRPGTPMWGFQKGSGVFADLTDNEIDQVIAYIRYMQKGLK